MGSQIADEGPQSQGTGANILSLSGMQLPVLGQELDGRDVSVGSRIRIFAGPEFLQSAFYSKGRMTPPPPN